MNRRRNGTLSNVSPAKTSGYLLGVHKLASCFYSRCRHIRPLLHNRMCITFCSFDINPQFLVHPEHLKQQRETIAQELNTLKFDNVCILQLTDHSMSFLVILVQEHPGLNKGEKKRICKLMDCKKLSPDACRHAAQNERLPLRVVVQVLFFEQARAAQSSGGVSRLDLPETIQALLPVENAGSHGSSRSATTITDEDWEAGPEELKSLKLDISSMRLVDDGKSTDDKGSGKTKGGIFKSRKILNKLWSGKSGPGENSSSDTSGSPGSGSANQEAAKSTPSRNRLRSVP